MSLEPQHPPTRPPLRESHTDTWMDLLKALNNHKRFIVLVFFTTVLSAYSYLQTQPDMYETGTSLLVKLGRENLDTPVTVDDGSMVNTGGVRTEDMNTEISMLLSRDLIEAAVEEIGLERFLEEPPPPTTFFKRIKYEVKKLAKGIIGQAREVLIFLDLKKRLSDRDNVIKGLQVAMGAEPGKESDVINVNIKTPNPVLAEEFLGALIDIYLERRVSVRGTRNVRSFFDQQVDSFQTRLRDMEDARERLLRETGVSSIDVQQELLLKRLHALYNDVERYEGERFLLTAGGKNKTTIAHSALLEGEAVGVEINLEPMKQRLANLRLRRVELLRTYAEGAEELATLDREIDAIEHLLFVSLEARIGKWRERAAKLEDELGALNDAEIALDALNREFKLTENNYFVYDQRKEEARMSEELDRLRVSNIAVIAAVSSSFEPVRPRKLLITVISIPVGLMLGIALALLIEYFNDMVRSDRDLSRIPGIDFLGEFHHG